MSKTAQRVSKEVTAKKTVIAKPPAKTAAASPKTPAKVVKAPSKTSKTASEKPTQAPASSAKAAPKTAAKAAPEPKNTQVISKAADSSSQKGAKVVATKAAKQKSVPVSLPPAHQIPAPAPVYKPSRLDLPTQMPQTATAVKVDPKLANAWKNKAGRDLSEAELLAMPDSEYMNEKQLEFFKARLDLLKEDLLSNAGETTEHLREDTSIVPDPADRATIEEEHALELRTRDRERKLLKKISQALVRIDSGEYGYCDETGEPIGLGRLIARPTATLSLEAQQRRELKQKLFGD
ncbi:RNA polymerase-binding protein DksA [Aquabacterium sp.]|uniref:RNA polymerase-binding protein DksA n=1 Tax=Aquabacterium sp. TaxID=1872578 RepID=UPI0035AFF8A0